MLQCFNQKWEKVNSYPFNTSLTHPTARRDGEISTCSLFHAGELQRRVGLKALEAGGNAVIG